MPRTTRAKRRDELAALLDKNQARGSAVEIAYWTLREAIRSGVIDPGERLIVLELSQALEMSRTPVREALRRLEAERIVDMANGRGLVAPNPSSEDLLDVLEIRGVLEGLAAQRAALRSGPVELGAMQAAIERMETALRAADLAATWEASSLFHRLVRGGSTRGRLAGMIAQLYDSYPRPGRREFASIQRAADAVAEHRAMFEAIAGRDVDAAARLAREHVQHALEAQLLAIHP